MDINAWLEIIILLLILFVYLYNRAEKQPKSLQVAYEHLRAEAFLPGRHSANPSAAAHPQLYGVIMEIGFPGAIATLITKNDGTANLYFSNGNGKTGKASPPCLRDATFHFLKQAQNYLPMFHRIETFPFPSKGSVRFYLLTDNGVYSAEVPEHQLKNSESCLSFLYQYGHDVITQLGKG